MAYFAVTYGYTADAERRDEHRAEHVRFLSAQRDAGRLLVSGPLDGGTGALLVFEGEGPDEVGAALDGDPFRREGLIARRSITPWNVVFGAERLARASA